MSAPGGGSPSAASGGTGTSGNKKEAAKALLKTGWLKTRSVLMNKSKIELLVEDATSLEPWGPTGPQMHEIAEACFDAEKFCKAWNAILRRFESEPEQWRRVYKALLLTEHLLKNSSQHVVQTVIDATGVLEGLKLFKYLDEKNKDHGINVSNRAKELVLLLQNTDRIRAERAKAKSLKEKFKGASREEMAATSGAPTSFGLAGAGTRSGAISGSSAGDAHSARSQRSAQHDDDDGHFGQGGPPLQGEARPSKGYGALASSASDAVAATAQRIKGLRDAGMLEEEQGSGGVSSASTPSGPLSGARDGGAAKLASSSSATDLTAAASGLQSPAKPSLEELMARRGPKKLQEVRVNPAIASTMAALGGTGAGAAKRLGAPPAQGLTVALRPPPGATVGASVSPPHSPAQPASVPGKASGDLGRALGDLLAGPALAPVAAPLGHSPHAASSGGSSPWTAADSSPAHSAYSPTAFDAFASAEPASKLGAGPGVISLTASAAPGASHHSSPALPAYMFAEPTPALYGATTSWGSHVAGGVQPGQHHTVLPGQYAAPKAPAEELFADFSPFK